MKTTNIQTTHNQAIIRGWVDGSMAADDSGSGGGGSVGEVQNGAGVDISRGDVVVLNLDGTVGLTTTANDTRPVGVALDDITWNEFGPIAWSGPVDRINVGAAVTAGQFAETSTTAGEADGVTVRSATSFGFFTASGSAPSGFLFGASGGSSPGSGSGYPWKSVKDYGALGDGVTDDTTTIQAAIDDCADYETLFFPVGVYVITSALTVSAPIRLLGNAGPPNWFHQAAYIYQTTANTGAITCTDFEGELAIESLGIVGAGLLARTAASGRGIYTAANLNLRDVQVQGFYDGVYIDDSLGGSSSSAYYNHIQNSWIHYNTHAGLLLHDQVNNTTVSETYFAFNAYGLYADGGGWGLTVSDSSFELHTVNGICIDGAGASQSSEGALITGCYFENYHAFGDASADIAIGPGTAVKAVTINGGMHVASDITALDHIWINKASGVTITGARIQSGTEHGSIFCNSSNTTNVTLVGVRADGSVTTPATTRILDQTDVTPATISTANGVGSSKYLARADHVHQNNAPAASFATPAIVLGTAAAAGAASTVIRSDSTIVAFDATAPTTQAFGDVAATGSAAVASRRDHLHGMPAEPTSGGAHAHVASETHLSDGSTTTYTLDEVFEPGSVIAWNVTTLARLTVVEAAPDQATVSAAGSAADQIVFDYAASIA